MQALALILQLLLMFVGMLLMIIILLQRGRGGGLAGAFGGLGGQSAFGTKAGDWFTWFTVGTATVWVLLAGISGCVMRHSTDEGAQRYLEAGAADDADFPLPDIDSPPDSPPVTLPPVVEDDMPPETPPETPTPETGEAPPVLPAPDSPAPETPENDSAANETPASPAAPDESAAVEQDAPRTDPESP